MSTVTLPFFAAPNTPPATSCAKSITCGVHFFFRNPNGRFRGHTHTWELSAWPSVIRSKNQSEHTDGIRDDLASYSSAGVVGVGEGSAEGASERVGATGQGRGAAHVCSSPRCRFGTSKTPEGVEIALSGGGVGEGGAIRLVLSRPGARRAPAASVRIGIDRVKLGFGRRQRLLVWRWTGGSLVRAGTRWSSP